MKQVNLLAIALTFSNIVFNLMKLQGYELVNVLGFGHFLQCSCGGCKIFYTNRSRHAIIYMFYSLA